MYWVVILSKVFLNFNTMRKEYVELWLHLADIETLCNSGEVFAEWFYRLHCFPGRDGLHVTGSWQALSLGIKSQQATNLGINPRTFFTPFLNPFESFIFINLNIKKNTLQLLENISYIKILNFLKKKKKKNFFFFFLVQVLNSFK